MLKRFSVVMQTKAEIKYNDKVVFSVPSEYKIISYMQKNIIYRNIADKHYVVNVIFDTNQTITLTFHTACEKGVWINVQELYV